MHKDEMKKEVFRIKSSCPGVDVKIKVQLSEDDKPVYGLLDADELYFDQLENGWLYLWKVKKGKKGPGMLMIHRKRIKKIEQVLN